MSNSRVILYDLLKSAQELNLETVELAKENLLHRTRTVEHFH